MLENLLNWVKAPKHLAWPLVIVSALLLWGPDDFKSGLGLETFINEYRKWLGIVFLFFLVVGLQPLGLFIMQKVKEKYKRLEDERRAEAKLKDLTPTEIEILRYYINNNTRTQDLSIQNGDVSKLISDGFLYLASQVSYGGMRGSFTFPVNITDWTWNYIRKNPDVLD